MEVRIDRLVLDGLDVAPAERPLLQAAVESELARLLSMTGLGAELQEGGAVERLEAPQITTADLPVPALGASVGRALGGALS